MMRDAYEQLLAQMRADFLAELTDLCEEYEELILALEKSAEDRESFNILYRGIHSLKGSGGTHGIVIITTLCHQLENLLSETDLQRNFDAAFVSRALTLVDLLRQVEVVGQQAQPDYSAIEDELDKQRKLTLQQRKAVMIVESSKMMSGLCQKALEGQPLQLTVVDDGLKALERLLNEPFELVILGRELKTLNGIPLMAALRASQSRYHGIPAVLITNRREIIPDYANFSAVIARDRDLTDNLLGAVEAVLSEEKA